MTGPGLRVRKHHRAGKGSSGLRVLRYAPEEDSLTWDSHKILGAAQHVLPMADVQVRGLLCRVALRCVALRRVAWRCVASGRAGPGRAGSDRAWIEFVASRRTASHRTTSVVRGFALWRVGLGPGWVVSQ